MTSGSIDTRVEVIRLTEGNQVAASEVLRGHSSYVQGMRVHISVNIFICHPLS